MALSPYASYKSHYQNFTPPFDIPASWQWVKLEDIGEIVTGSTPSKSDTSNYGCEYPFYKPNDLEQGFYTTKSNDNLSAKGMAAARELPIGSVLVTCIGATIGKTGIIRTKGASNQQINAIIPNMAVDSEYLYYIIIGEYFQNSIKQRASSTTLPILNKGDFSKLLIPIPPKEEQKRITGLILSLFDIISYIENAASSLKDSVKTTKTKILDLAMQGKLVPQDPADEPAADMLRRINPKAKIITDNPHYPQLPDNWVLTKLGDVVKVINGKSQKEVENPSGAYPIYGSGGVIGKADAYSCLSGSTIIGRKGTINNPQFIETNFWNVDTAFGMKPYEAVNDLYFYYFCKSFDFTSLDKSSTLPSLTKTAIEGILMPTPPLGEQRRIILKIKEYDELFRNIFTQIGQK